MIALSLKYNKRRKGIHYQAVSSMKIPSLSICVNSSPPAMRMLFNNSQSSVRLFSLLSLIK